MSIDGDIAREEIARNLAGVRRDLDGLVLSRQIVHSSIVTSDGSEQQVADILGGAADVVADYPELGDSVAYLDESQELDQFNAEDLRVGYEVAVDDAHEARLRVADVAVFVDEVNEAAREAAEAAANAQTTANGKNARRRGKTEPDPPEGGWAQGDQWAVENDDGKPVEVRVWNGTEFVPDQILADEILVLGDDGVIRLANGVVSAEQLTATAIDGKTITGTLIRTAASGRRLQLDDLGLRTFNDSDVETARLSSQGGALALQGELDVVGAIRSGRAGLGRAEVLPGMFRLGAGEANSVEIDGQLLLMRYFDPAWSENRTEIRSNFTRVQQNRRGSDGVFRTASQATFSSDGFRVHRYENGESRGNGAALGVNGVELDSDEDWTSLRPIAPFQMYGAGDTNLLQVIRKGDMVQLTGVLSCVTAGHLVGTVARTMTMLGPKFRPDKTSVRARVQGSGSDSWYIGINPDGTVSGARYSGTQGTGVWLPIHVVFRGAPL